MNFNEQLISLRKQQGWSQEQLGEKIGVSRQTVSKWELGDTTPEMEKLIKLSELFHISIDEMVGNQKDTAPSSDAVIMNYLKGHYEYTSKIKIGGLPLVHINKGKGLFSYRAKGIIAIGNIATGLISIGCLATGLISIGLISVGVFALGTLSLALILAIGALSIAPIAIGALALGIFAIGACSFGVYSLGGCAIASKIAAGGYANAPIAIGDETNGIITFDLNRQLVSHEIRNAIMQRYPETWKIVADIFSSLH